MVQENLLISKKEAQTNINLHLRYILTTKLFIAYNKQQFSCTVQPKIYSSFVSFFFSLQDHKNNINNNVKDTILLHRFSNFYVLL